MSISWTELSSDSFTNPELSKQARMRARNQTRLNECVEPSPEFSIGKKSGDKVQVKLYGRISGTAETALLEFQKIPFGDLPEYSIQIPAYKRGYALISTMQRLDLDRTNIDSAIVKALQEHAARTKNKIVYDALVAGRSHCYVALTSSAGNFTSTGSPSGTAAAAFSMFHLRKMVLGAKQVNMPLADGSNYWFFGSPRIESDLLLDVGTNGFVDIAKYDPSRVGGIMNGEIGKAATCRFVIDNDALTDTVSSVYAMGFMTGAEALREVCVYPFHLRAQRNLGQDFDSQMAMAWVSFLGVKALWNHTTHGIGSIVHYTSA